MQRPNFTVNNLQTWPGLAMPLHPPAPPNHHVNFANDIFEADGLAFGEVSFPDVNMIDDDIVEFSSPTN
jgi:hypothetical protein